MNIISYYSAINLSCWLTSITELRRNKCSIRIENKQVSSHFTFIVISLYADSFVLFRMPTWKLIFVEFVSLFSVMLMYYIQNRFYLFEDVVSTICHERIFLRNFKMHFKCYDLNKYNIFVNLFYLYFIKKLNVFKLISHIFKNVCFNELANVYIIYFVFHI